MTPYLKVRLTVAVRKTIGDFPVTVDQHAGQPGNKDDPHRVLTLRQTDHNHILRSLITGSLVGKMQGHYSGANHPDD